MIKIILITSTVILFFAVKWLAYLISSKLPIWLDYQPFNCNDCLSFWLNLFISIVLSICLIGWVGLPYIVLTVLDGVAMYIDKKKFVDLN